MQQTLLSDDFLQDVSKRMSLPMDIRLPPEFVKKLQLESENSPLCKPVSRMSRRASLVSALYSCTLYRIYLSMIELKFKSPQAYKWLT